MTVRAHSSRIFAWLSREFRELFPVVIFFALGFNLIVLTTNLFLSDYGQRLGNYLLAIVGAWVVGKAVLVANTTPFLRRYDTMPLAWSILYKALVYSVVATLARIIELSLENWLESKTMAEELLKFSWHRFLAVHIWLFVLFLIYVTFNEMNLLFGEGELKRILFTHRSAQLARGRRERTRMLMQLSNLTASHTPRELAHPGSPVNAELLRLLEGLAKTQNV